MTVSTETAGARDGLRAIVRQALATLNPQERLRYRIAVVVQVLLSLLDLVGVLLLGVVGYLLASGGTGALPEPVASVIDRLGTSNESTALALAAIAAVVLLVKSSTALLIQSRITRYLGQRSGLVGSDIARRFLQQPLLEVQSWSSQKVTYALLEGVTGLIVGVLGSYMIIISEISLLVVLTAGLLLVDPLTAIVAVGYFGVIGIGLGRWLRRRSRSAGAATTESAVASRIAAHSALETLPETTVMNRRRHFLDEFSGSRMQYATSRSEALVLGLIPRFGMEAALVVGAGLTAMTLWLTGDRTSAIAGLALFIAAAMRLMPALLRLHAAYITLHNQAAAAWTAYDLASALDEGPSLRVSTTSSLVEQSPLTTIGHSDGGSVPAGFTLADNATLPNSEGRRGATVLVENVNLYYPDSPTPALRSVDLSVEPGRSLALAGPTGSGKSSLIAVILGLIEPQSGRVLIDGVDPRQLVSRSANAIGYVPQAVALIDASVRDNVALALDAGQVHDESVWAALRKAHLADFVAALPAGLDTQIGERGVRLSGGQRQRVGLARALYRTPRLLVLDEATSALDAETERVVADTLKALEGNVTTITVAHRLATIRHVDSVAYIESGQLIAVGTFDEVRQMVPGFERQANLLGL